MARKSCATCYRLAATVLYASECCPRGTRVRDWKGPSPNTKNPSKHDKHLCSNTKPPTQPHKIRPAQHLSRKARQRRIASLPNSCKYRKDNTHHTLDFWWVTASSSRAKCLTWVRGVYCTSVGHTENMLSDMLHTSRDVALSKSPVYGRHEPPNSSPYKKQPLFKQLYRNTAGMNGSAG